MEQYITRRYSEEEEMHGIRKTDLPTVYAVNMTECHKVKQHKH